MVNRIRTPEEALWVADALAAQVTQLRSTLDHRSIFSMGYNRKLAKKIELIEQIREEYMILSRDLHQERLEAKRRDESTQRSPGGNPV